MLLVLGESLATGRYSFFGGIPSGMEEEDDLFQENNDNESAIDPSLHSSSLRSSTNTRPGTPLLNPSRPSTADSQITSEASETQSQKRHRESTSLQVSHTAKKTKVSGVTALNGISEGLLAMAEAVIKGQSEQAIKETVDDTLQGQAQKSMQHESCLSDEGQLVMLQVLADASLARTFLAIDAEKLRTKWLKKQLEKYVQDNGGDLEELFIE